MPPQIKKTMELRLPSNERTTVLRNFLHFDLLAIFKLLPPIIEQNLYFVQLYKIKGYETL